MSLPKGGGGDISRSSGAHAQKDAGTTTGMASKKMCYFYIIIPPEDQAVSQDTSKAVSTREELTAIMKRNPRARFQSASSAEEAERKALECLGKIQVSKEAESVSSKPKNEEREKRKGRQSFSAVEESIGAPSIESPKTGELLMTGREIITKQNEKVFERISKNPRILCTDTEFPTILQEGCKYNALHLAAKSNNFEVMKRILDLISCIDFLRQIYPKQSDLSLRASSKHLISSYLNNPDKMMQETPLHFACKFNAVECVDLLLSHPYCNTTLPNFDKETPFQVIGSRDSSTSAKATTIRRLFTDRFIVPIWRDLSVDGEAPVLGKVTYINDLGEDIPYPLLQEKFPNFSLSLLEQCKPEVAPSTSKFSPTCENLNSLRLFANRPCNWKIRAFAGPMSEADAIEFRTVMKRSRGQLYGITSPESSFNLSSNLSFNGNGKKLNNFNINDDQNGSFISENPLRSPPSSENSLNSPPNLNLNSPLRSPGNPGGGGGYSRRSLFNTSANPLSPLRNGMDLRVRDIEKGLERIALEYCVDLGLPWSEYWPFLGRFCNLSIESGIELLEAHLRQLEAEAREAEVEELITSASHNKSTDLDSVIEKFYELKLNGSGIASPQKDSDGFCTNPRCRMNARFCNCVDVVPPIPYDLDDDYSWMYKKLESISLGVVPLSVKGERREPEHSPSTDSLSFSFGSQDEEFDFEWQWPGDYLPEVYRTAPSSPVEKDVFEDCKNPCIFLSRDDRPGKTDHQVFNLLKDFSEIVDSSKYYRTFQWINSMRAYGNTLRNNFAAFRGIGRDNPLNENETTETDSELASPPRNCNWEPTFVSTPIKENINLSNCLKEEEGDGDHNENFGYGSAKYFKF